VGEMGPFLVLIFRPRPPATDLQKTVKLSRVLFNFALKRATWRRYARPDLIPAYPCHHVVK
jgi:hypothetical protein